MKKNILIAPNAFKHSLNARDVSNAIKKGFQAVQWNGDLTCFPIGDGGTGTGELLIEALQADRIKTPVENLLGVIELIEWGWCDDSQLAIIDLASVNGIDKITAEQRDPLRFNTYGTGQLLKTALEKGAKKILLCIGGSATIDGGIGIAQALGVKFIDHKGMEISQPKDLIHLSEIDITNKNKLLQQCRIKVLCDVNTYFIDEENAIQLYGPQKGATAEIQHQLLKAFKRYNQILKYSGFGSLNELMMSGAAGGVAGGLNLLFKTELLNGFEVFYEAVQLESVLPQYQILITGEGKLDQQTLEGKGPFAIAEKARNFNIHTIAIAGKIEDGFEIVNTPFDEVYDIISKFNDPIDFSQTASHLTALSTEIAIDLKDRLWKH